MSWYRLDDEFPEHPKLKRVPRHVRLAAIGLFVSCGCHANRRLTDGFIETAVVSDWPEGEILAAHLVRAGMWAKSEGGWQIHDHLDYNPSRADIEERRRELSAKRSEAGRKGAQSRWGLPEGLPDTSTQVGDGNDGKAIATPKQADGPVPVCVSDIQRHTGTDASEPQAARVLDDPETVRTVLEGFIKDGRFIGDAP